MKDYKGETGSNFTDFIEIYNSFKSNSDFNDFEFNQTTSSVNSIEQDYFAKLPEGIDITHVSSAKINEIENNEVKKQVLEIYKMFQKALLLFYHANPDENYSLPDLKLHPIEDEGILIHWSFKDFKIGLFIEKKIRESSWTIVANENVREYGDSGMVSDYPFDVLIPALILFALKNS
jgi:hypothetical protein